MIGQMGATRIDFAWFYFRTHIILTRAQYYKPNILTRAFLWSAYLLTAIVAMSVISNNLGDYYDEGEQPKNARNFFMCALIDSEYEKVHNCKSSKEMWDTFALAYEWRP
ncbi:hypothetical protein CR513_11745, partial [Mucuna pruriens]